MSGSVVGARAVLRGFGWRPLGRARPTITDLDLLVEPGERVLLVGPSGAGKSTILHALAGVLGEALPGERTGEVTVDGRVGLVPQNPGAAVVSDRIGRDVAFGPENVGVAREEIWRRVRAALGMVALTHPLDHPTSALSGGELQRLALAGVLALRPGLLLLDEPTSMLDADNAARVRTAVIDAVGRTGATLVVVDHRLDGWLRHVDRVVVIDADGAIRHDVTPELFGRGTGGELGRVGVWVPDLPAPTPLAVPARLVAPDRPTPRLHTRALEVRLRTRTFRGPVTTQALRGLDTVVEPGAVAAFTGPSGAGKSTLVAVLSGLIRPTGGTVSGTATPLHRMRSADLARLVGWVPQNPEHGFLTTSVRQEITHTGRRLGVDVDLELILDLFRLSPLANANPYRLSGGEQRRVALAAALAHRPPVLMLDEPTVGQDRNTWAATVGWIRAAAGAGAAVGVSTHDDDLIAVADHETVLRDGLVAAR